MNNVAQKIDTYLQAHLDEYISETERLCAQPSISASNEGIQECVELVVEILKQHDFRVEKYKTPGNPVIVGRAKGRSKRTLLFYNHYDVQPPDPLDLWTTPPFEPTIRDGALYARGAADDKGEFIARLAAVDAVREAYNGELPCNVIFVVEGEEEVGSPNIAEFVQQNKDTLRCDGAIWEEGGIGANGNPNTFLGTKGVLGVELSIQVMKEDKHSGGAHALPSAAWHLVWALEALKGADERVRIPGFYEHIRPVSALDLELVDARPTDQEDFFRELIGIKEFLLGRTGKDLNRAVFEPTCNIQGISTGYQGEGMKTIIPSKASAKLDFRLVPDQDPYDIFEKLRTYLAEQGFEDVEITQNAAMWPSKTAADDPLIQLAAQTGEEVYGLPMQIAPLTGGSSPVYAFDQPLGGIPVVFAGIGYWDNRIHAPDEHIRLEDFLNGSRHIAHILDGFSELPERNR